MNDRRAAAASLARGRGGDKNKRDILPKQAKVSRANLSREEEKGDTVDRSPCCLITCALSLSLSLSLPLLFFALRVSILLAA